MRSRTPPRDLACVALIAGGTVLFEVLLTRVLAIVLFADLAFGAIAVALLGLGAGSFLAAILRAPDDAGHARNLRRALVLGAAAALLAAALTAWLRLIPDELKGSPQGVANTFSLRRSAFRSNPSQLHALSFVVVVFWQAIPFCAAGYALASILRRAAARSGSLYAADVAGATAGALLALVVLRWFGAVNGTGAVALAFVAAAALVTPAARTRMGATLAAVAAGSVAVLVFQPISIRFAAGFPEKHVVDTEWSALARVSLYDPSPNRGAPGRSALLLVDNTSRSEVAFLDDRRFWQNLERIPYSLRPDGDVLVIGAGGGQEIATALETGTARTRLVDAIEVAAGMPSLLRKHFASEPGFLLDQPGVDYRIADGRSFVEMSPRRWSVIQMKELNFHTLAGQASTVWSPSLLFTREAYREYFRHLEPSGLLSVTTFYSTRKGDRLPLLHKLSTLRAAAADEGLELGPRILIVRRPYSYGFQQMTVFSMSPFSDGDLVHAATLASNMRLTVVRSPRIPMDEPDVEEMIAGPSAATLERLGTEEHLSLEPVEDDRPFGHLHVGYLDALAGRASRSPDAVVQTANFRILTGAIVLLSALTALVIGVSARMERSRAAHVEQLGLAALLGTSFMLLEVVLIERAGLLLGHPTVALVTVLVGMLVGLAAGSFLSQRFQPEATTAIRRMVSAASVASAFALAPLLPAIMPWLRESVPEDARAVVVGLLLFVGATPLGFLLPTMLRHVGTLGGSPAACWASNSAASVLGTVAAAQLVRTAGFRDTAILAGCLYLAAVLLWLRLLARRADVTSALRT